MNIKKQEKVIYTLTKDGKACLELGTPEFRLFNLIPEEGVNFKDFKKANGALCKFGMKNGMKNKWFKIDKGNLCKNVETVVDQDK